MAVNTWDRIRYNAFCWRTELSIVQKLALALGMTIVTGLLAQVRFALPFTPVPITGQTFGVLLAGVLLGQWWGGISMLLYVALGIAGVPLFTGWGSGIAWIAGPTGGYLVGFVLAALFVGFITDRFVKVRRFPAMLGLFLVADFLIIYIPGLAGLYFWSNLISHNHATLLSVVMMGAVPFFIGDALKAGAAAAIASTITPKIAFGKRETE
jgi:biotin transport system substrate-specific component